MFRSLFRIASFVVLILILTGIFFAPTNAHAKKKFTVAWSIYVGWMPWAYAENASILKQWADKYDIEIELVRMDYISSVEAFVAKQVDGCVMTNMECLDMPAASGVDSTVLIMGDYSNGNDAILTRDGITIKDLPGSDIYLVELSVSHYLLGRCLAKNALQERQVTIVNTNDSDIGPVFLANEKQKVVVTWNPIVMNIEQAPGVSKIFTSADIPGEILDLMVVETSVLKDNPEFGKALVGAWYEVMGIVSKRGHPNASGAFEYMAAESGATVTEYKNQLRTTAMFYTAQKAVEYARSKEVQTNMNSVRQFCFSHGLLGEGAESVDEVGILYPDGTVQGDADNIRMRFDVSYMEMAANGELTVQ